MTAIATPAELRALVAGKSDPEIHTALEEVGVEQALDQVFAGMAEAFLPEKAGGRSAVIQYDVASAAGTRSYQLHVADGRCTPARGTPERPRVTFALGAPDFLRLVTGELKGQTAFFAGKLKLTGDLMLAQTAEHWFRIG